MLTLLALLSCRPAADEAIAPPPDDAQEPASPPAPEVAPVAFEFRSEPLTRAMVEVRGDSGNGREDWREERVIRVVPAEGRLGFALAERSYRPTPHAEGFLTLAEVYELDADGALSLVSRTGEAKHPLAWPWEAWVTSLDGLVVSSTPVSASLPWIVGSGPPEVLQTELRATAVHSCRPDGTGPECVALSGRASVRGQTAQLEALVAPDPLRPQQATLWIDALDVEVRTTFRWEPSDEEWELKAIEPLAVRWPSPKKGFDPSALPVDLRAELAPKLTTLEVDCSEYPCLLSAVALRGDGDEAALARRLQRAAGAWYQHGSKTGLRTDGTAIVVMALADRPTTERPDAFDRVSWRLARAYDRLATE